MKRSPRAAVRAAATVVVCLVALAAAVPVALAQPAPSLDDFGLLVATQSRPSFSILGAGARAAGMGGAFTALADDASAASFNPAGLALLLSPEASLVLDGQRRQDDHSAFLDMEGGELETYGSSSSDFETGGLNFASFTVPTTVADRNLCLQLSFHRLIDFTYDSDRSFPETGDGGEPLAELRQVVGQRGDVRTFSLAAAYQLTQRLSVGLTVSRWIGDWRFDTRTTQLLAEPGSEPSTLQFRQRNKWDGWNYTAGALLRYRYLNVGLAFRSGFQGNYRVDSRLDTSFDSPFGATSSFDGTLVWPSSYTLGIAVKPTQTWFLTADYAEFDWDDMVIRGLGPDGSGEVSFFDLQPKETTTVRNVGQWRFGTEYTFFPGESIVALRGGYFREPRPQLLSPSDEKSSRRGVSLGVGWRRGPVSVDLAYQHATEFSRVLEFVDPETVASGEVAAQAEGRVDTTRDRYFVSVLYQFESRRALRNLLHFLFVGPNEQGGEEAGGGDAGETGDGGGGDGAS